MPSIEEIDDFSDPDDAPLPSAPPASAPKAKAPPPRQAASGAQGYPHQMRYALPPEFAQGNPNMRIVQKEVYKSWTTLYPIYLDAKRPYKDGFRRVPKTLAMHWPLGEHMAAACASLGLETVYEPDKTHPKDWANPGRVKVLLVKDDGSLVNSAVDSKRSLLRIISPLLRPAQAVRPTPTAENPKPLAPIAHRLPQNSPAISHGILENALAGGGMMGMMGNMFGGGAAPGGEKEDEMEAIEPVKKKEPVKVMQKPRKVHMKRR